MSNRQKLIGTMDRLGMPSSGAECKMIGSFPLLRMCICAFGIVVVKRNADKNIDDE